MTKKIEAIFREEKLIAVKEALAERTKRNYLISINLYVNQNSLMINLILKNDQTIEEKTLF